MNKFKVGDRVKFVKKVEPFFSFERNLPKGITGVVRELGEAAEGILVYWEKPINSGCWVLMKNCINIGHTSITYIINKRATIVILPDGRKGVAKCHPDDKFDEYEGLRIATARAYGKDPFPKEEVKDEKKEPEYKFNVGDVVVVINWKRGFPSFDSKFKEIAPLGKWAGSQSIFNGSLQTLKNGDVFKVIGRGQHDWDCYGNVYAIQDFDGNGYLIGEKGIAKVEVNI